MSSHQQDLPATALFRRCLSLGGFTEWQLLANRDYELAIPHRFGHELKCFPVEFREYRHYLYSCLLRGVLRRLEHRSKPSSRLDLGDQLLGGSSVDRVRHRVERGEIRN